MWDIREEKGTVNEILERLCNEDVVRNDELLNAKECFRYNFMYGSKKMRKFDLAKAHTP